jgi:hypothetical protein
MFDILLAGHQHVLPSAKPLDVLVSVPLELPTSEARWAGLGFLSPFDSSAAIVKNIDHRGSHVKYASVQDAQDPNREKFL